MITIKQRQLNLYYCGGYYTGQIDGIEGPLLKGAYGEFQKDAGLVVDKIYGPKTEAALIKAVKEMQQELNDKGASLIVDGLVGVKTIEAINTFKSSANFWDNIKYFKRNEFKCDCSGKYCNGFPVEPDANLVKLLDQLRGDLAKPITVTSGIRCEKRNTEVGGIANSMHLKGKAADIYVSGVSQQDIKTKAYELGAKYSYYGTASMGKAVHINI